MVELLFQLIISHEILWLYVAFRVIACERLQYTHVKYSA